jgi:hypothetical protein
VDLPQFAHFAMRNFLSCYNSNMPDPKGLLCKQKLVSGTDFLHLQGRPGHYAFFESTAFYHVTY